MGRDLERKHIISNTACHYPDSRAAARIMEREGAWENTILAHKMRALLCGTQTT